MCYTEHLCVLRCCSLCFSLRLLWHSGRIYIPTGSMLITLSCNSKYPCLSLLEIEIIKCILINPIIILFPQSTSVSIFPLFLFQRPADFLLTIPVSSKQHLQINWTALLNGRLCVYEIKKNRSLKHFLSALSFSIHRIYPWGIFLCVEWNSISNINRFQIHFLISNEAEWLWSILISIRQKSNRKQNWHFLIKDFNYKTKVLSLFIWAV